MAKGVTSKLIGTIVPLVAIAIIGFFVLPTILSKLSSYQADVAKAKADQQAQTADNQRAVKEGFLGYIYTSLFGEPNPSTSNPNDANSGNSQANKQAQDANTQSANDQSVADANTVNAGTDNTANAKPDTSVAGDTPTIKTDTPQPSVNSKNPPNRNYNEYANNTVVVKPSSNKVKKFTAGASSYQSIFSVTDNLPSGDLSNTVTTKTAPSIVSNPKPSAIATTPAERLAEYNASLAKLQSSIKGSIILNSQPVRSNKGGSGSSTISSPRGIKKVGGASQFQSIIQDAGNLPV